MKQRAKIIAAFALALCLCAPACAEEFKIRITAAGHEFAATLEDNVATRALIEKLPLTVYMDDLYDRELCYHFGRGGLPTGSLRSDGYDVGDIIYWPPRGSLVILYRQNGELFTRQHLGHIESGTEFFETTGSISVTFERQ